MKEENFKDSQRKNMETWRKTNIATKEFGTQSKNRETGEPVYHSHIIPKQKWEETLWEGIRFDLHNYLLDNPDISFHTGTHNLLSSWVVCANLYFPIYKNASLKQLMLEFLKQNVSEKITEITDVELEFAFPKGDKLHPSELLGELDGSKGSWQTSPDVAFWVNTKEGQGLILTECKYTEHSFYRCSARRKEERGEHEGNPDASRCLQSANNCDYKQICHQKVWGRKYLSLINFTDKGKNKLTRCPAATTGYQLLRQQALAEGIAYDKRFDLVASTVAFDERNSTLKGCLRTTGIDDFQTGWGELFEGKAIFKTWTHQSWVKFVRKNQKNSEFNGWLEYLNGRYGY